MSEGASLEKIQAVNDYKNSALFSEREKMALTFAEKMVFTDDDVSDAFFAALRTIFSDRAMVELNATIVIEDLLSKFDHAFLVEAQGFCLLPEKKSA
jgi:alkylhydroperoxidase family enzyme